MSTYGFTRPELKFSSTPSSEGVYEISLSDIIDNHVPIDEIKPHMVSPSTVYALQKYVIEHLLVYGDEEIKHGGYSERVVAEIEENSRLQLEAIREINPVGINERDLMLLMQKAKSYKAELDEAAQKAA